MVQFSLIICQSLKVVFSESSREEIKECAESCEAGTLEIVKLKKLTKFAEKSSSFAVFLVKRFDVVV
jgi:hypothetical protein